MTESNAKMHGPKHRAILWSLAAIILLCSPAQAQSLEGVPEPLEPPPLAPSVRHLLGGDLLTDTEKHSTRLRHGLWTEADLATAADRARAALVRGAIDDPSLTSFEADTLDRAEGMALRGELRAALDLLAGQSSLRAIRIRAEALERLGFFEEADAALDPLVARLSSKPLDSGDELAEGVRALMVRNRLRGLGRSGQAEADYRSLMSLLGRAKNELDRLSWYARLIEAEILLDKDNPAEAQTALREVLSLNPRCARAWRLLGDMAVASFDFGRAESIALRLDALAEGSPDAAIIRARGALRRKDAALASGILEDALARYPQHRGLLAAQAATSAVSFHEDRTRKLLAAFDALNGHEANGPGSPEALLAVGTALSEARQYDEAASALQQAAARQPRLARPLIELGLLEMQAGRDIRARDALTRALALDPFNVRAKNSLELVEFLAGFAEIESEHFVVRYKPGLDEVLATEMPEVLEALYQDICSQDMFDHEPEIKTIIEVMPDHATFAVRITGMPKVHTMAAATGPVIAMETPRAGAGHKAGAYDWSRTIRHEFIHTVTLSRTHNRIPHWFTEAAAVWGEGGPRPWEWWTLLTNAYIGGSLFDMDTISLRFVRPIAPMDRTQAYAQGHWMYEFLVKRFGVRAPLEMMDIYATGRSEHEAMTSVLGISPDEFFREFKAWAHDELVDAGMLLTEGTPALADLLPDTREISRDELAGLLDAHPAHPDLLQLTITRALQEADGNPTAEMIPFLERYARSRPVDPLPRRLLARLALEGKMEDAPEQALEHLVFLDVREMRSPAYAMALAQRYAELGRMDEAWAKVRRATMISPFDAAIREQAARMALLRGDLEAAEKQLEALAKIEPNRELHRRRLEALRRKMKDKG